MNATTAAASHAIENGARVRVLVDDDRGRKWYSGVVAGLTRIGTAFGAGWPTYDVETDDGRRYDHASPECVRVVKS